MTLGKQWSSYAQQWPTEPEVPFQHCGNLHISAGTEVYFYGGGKTEQWLGSRGQQEGPSHTATVALGISGLGQYLPGISILGALDACEEGYLRCILWNEGPLLESPVLQGRT